jgi:hypothetical protein
MDKVLNFLERRLDRIIAVIQCTSAHERLLVPASAAEVDLNESTEDSLEDSCMPVLWSSLETHRIVDVGSIEVENIPLHPIKEVNRVVLIKV